MMNKHFSSIVYPDNPDFSFTIQHRIMRNAYEVVNRDDEWNTIRSFNEESYTDSNDEYIIKLNKKIITTGQSKTSLEWTMKQLKYISINGFYKYKVNWVNKTTVKLNTQKNNN
jgi:hypothetical protein